MRKLICMIVIGLLAGCKTDDFDFDIPPVVVPTTTTTTVSAPTTTTQPAITDKLIPDQLYPPIYNIENATQLTKGFVWNPSNSKRKGKIVLPAKYAGAVWATYFNDSWSETSKRFNKNDEGNRPRFYTKTGIESLPTSIYIRVHIVESGAAKDVWVFIPDTRKRMG